jgi:hypothetical protein
MKERESLCAEMNSAVGFVRGSQSVGFTVWQQKAANSARGLRKQFCQIYILPTVCLQIDSIYIGSEDVQL